jgi:hypothetical protein
MEDPDLQVAFSLPGQTGRYSHAGQGSIAEYEESSGSPYAENVKGSSGNRGFGE